MRVPMSEASIQRARKYAYHFFFRRMIPLKCVKAMDASPPFRANIGTLQSLCPGQDPGLDVICEGILHGAEFVYQAEKISSDAGKKRSDSIVPAEVRG